jgi:hypothetical protein
MSALALTFRIFRGDTLVREETLRQTVIKIGKVSSAHLRIDDESVSRMHAILEVDTAGNVHVIDLGSTRGTYINGHKVNKAKLESGDAIAVGDMRVEVAFSRTDAVVAAPAVVAVAPPPKVLFGNVQLDDDHTSAKAIEVAAMLGDSVVGVKHCIDPKGGQISSKTYGLFAGGAACLLASAIAFGASIHTAGVNKAGLEYTKNVLHHPAYAFRPEVLDPAFDWIAFGGLVFGASALIAGLARARGERRSPYYRIGTAPNVELALDSAPSASFPLVAPSADGEDFIFNYSAGIEGELVLDGKTTSLAALAATGRPSARTNGAIELPIPARARIRARSGQTTFAISAVQRPREQPLSLLGALESRTAKYFVGSLMVHLCLLVVLDQLPADDSTANFEIDDHEGVVVSIAGQTKDDPPPDKVDPTTGETESTGTAVASMKAPDDAGAAGRPDSTAQNKRMAVMDRHVDPAIARAEAVEEARTAGFLGVISSHDNFENITGQVDVSSGLDNLNAYGQMFGADVGDAAGNFGLSRSGFGHGGGCKPGEQCGLVGTGGRYNTISYNDLPGGGYPWGPGGPKLRRHEAGVPHPILGQATGIGDLDQATIRRYIKRNIEKISYCYEHELLAHPTMEGTVLVQFFITPTGSVTGSKGSGFDATVASCVASVVGNIDFPKPNGGGVQVNYPFTFRAQQ